MASHARALRLTHDRLLSVMRYEPETGRFFWLERRQGAKADLSAGSRQSIGYVEICIDQERFLAHRLAWFYMTRAWPEREIDHRNLDRGDNSWTNLRAATSGENKQNVKDARAGNRSGQLGVSRHHSGRFKARITVEGKENWLGLFDTPQLAHAAYLNAKPKFHPFAST